MKRFLFAFAIILLIASPASALTSAIQACVGASSAGSSCTTSVFSATAADNSYTFGADAGQYYRGNVATLAAGKTICKITVALGRNTGDLTGKTLTLNIWGMSGNNINLADLKGSSSGFTCGATTFNCTTGDVGTFTIGSGGAVNMSPITLAAGTYAITLDQGDTGSGNYVKWMGSSTDAVADVSWGRWDVSGVRQNAGLEECYMVPYE